LLVTTTFKCYKWKLLFICWIKTCELKFKCHICNINLLDQMATKSSQMFNKSIPRWRRELNLAKIQSCTKPPSQTWQMSVIVGWLSKSTQTNHFLVNLSALHKWSSAHSQRHMRLVVQNCCVSKFYYYSS
jgi:hypothetical protein